MKKTTFVMVFLMAVAFTPQISLGALSQAVLEVVEQEQARPIMLARSDDAQAEKDAKKAARDAEKEARKAAHDARKLDNTCSRKPDLEICQVVSN